MLDDLLAVPQLSHALAGAALFAIGFHGLLAAAHAIRRIIALNVMGTGVFLLLVVIARRAPDGAVDPVPHAMVLTGIVVAVCATGFALALADRVAADDAGEASGGAEP